MVSPSPARSATDPSGGSSTSTCSGVPSVGDDRHDAAAQAAERLVALGVGPQRTAHEHALGRDADGGADGGRSTERTDDPGDPAGLDVSTQRAGLAHCRSPPGARAAHAVRSA